MAMQEATSTELLTGSPSPWTLPGRKDPSWSRTRI
jgi:hypothetical protein